MSLQRDWAHMEWSGDFLVPGASGGVYRGGTEPGDGVGAADEWEEACLSADGGEDAFVFRAAAIVSCPTAPTFWRFAPCSPPRRPSSPRRRPPFETSLCYPYSFQCFQLVVFRAFLPQVVMLCIVLVGHGYGHAYCWISLAPLPCAVLLRCSTINFVRLPKLCSFYFFHGDFLFVQSQHR